MWTPGIYDRVSLLLADSPVDRSVQVAPQNPRLDDPRPDAADGTPARRCVAEIVHRVKTWKGGRAVGQPVAQRVELAAGEEKTLTQSIALPNATLWCPENPFLYVLETSTGGD